jgi:hypothetical protein
MALQQPDPHIESAIDSAQTVAYSALATVQKSLIGAGPESHAAMKALADRAVMLSGTGSTVRDYLDKLKADESQPLPYRQQMNAQIHKAAEQRLREDRDHLVKTVLPQLEHTLGEATLPTPSKDAGERQLRRQEVATILAGATGPALVMRMTDMLGKNVAHDSELLSDYGKALMEAGGVNSNDQANFRRGAIGKLMSNPVGSEKQLANRRALAAMYEHKLAGHVDGLAQIARHRLGDL